MLKITKIHIWNSMTTRLIMQTLILFTGLSTPQRHQILRINREEMLDDVISHDKSLHLCSLIPIDVYST